MNLREVELFENLLQVDLGKASVDLHNDYSCVGIDYTNQILVLNLENDNDKGIATLQFTEVEIIKLTIALKNDEGSFTLDNFYRGRYEFDGKLFDEYKNKRCFYLEFYEGGSIELLCTNASLLIGFSDTSMLS